MKLNGRTITVSIVIIIVVILGIWLIVRSSSSTSTVTPSPEVTTTPTPNPTTSDTTQGTTTSSTQTGSTTYTLADVSQHASASDCWTIISGKVYNITSYIPQHPGGKVIAQACGKVGDSLFGRMDARTQQMAMNVMKQYYIGDAQ